MAKLPDYEAKSSRTIPVAMTAFGLIACSWGCSIPAVATSRIATA